MSARDDQDNRGVFIELWVLDLVGQDFPAAMLLSQVLWWAQPGKNGKPRMQFKRDGHRWLVRADADPEWWDECRLSKKQVIQAKTRLRQAGFIETIRVHSEGKWVSGVRPLLDTVSEATVTGSAYSRSGGVTKGTLPDREEPVTPDREASLCPTSERGRGPVKCPPTPIDDTVTDLFAEEGGARSARQGAPKGPKAQVDRHLPAFLAKYPPVPDSSERAVRSALTRALKRSSAAEILAGLDAWAAHWAEDGTLARGYVPKPESWLAKDSWTTTPRRRPTAGRSNGDAERRAFLARRTGQAPRETTSTSTARGLWPSPVLEIEETKPA